MQCITERTDMETIGRLISRFFSEDIESVARETKLVQRRSQLTGTVFLQVLVFGFLRHPQGTLRQLVRLCAELGVWLTPQALDGRINTYSVEFLKALFERGFAVFRNQCPLPMTKLQHFTHINLVDSSTVTLPDTLEEEYPGCGGGGPRASMKIQLVFDFLRGNLQQLEFQTGRSTDQAYREYLQVVEAGSLTLVDLGYFCLASFKTIASRGAYFLTRYFYPTKVLTPEGKPVDLLQLFREPNATQIDIPILLGAQMKLPGRLIAERVPQEVADERRRKLREKVRRGKRTPYSKTSLALQGWTVWVTNAPQEQLSSTQIRCLYRVRWQIELIFKLWKSYCGLPIAHQQRRERILTEVYAKMLGILMCNYLVAPLRVPDAAWQDRELSAVHARKILGEFALRILHNLQDLQALIKHLELYHKLLSKYGCMEKRKKRPNVMQRLAAAGLA